MSKKEKPRDQPKKSRYTEASCFRNFTFLMYQDSAIDGWQEALASMHIPCAISPLHDQDIKEDGSVKKPHYHVVLMYTQKHSIGQVLEIIEEIHGVPDITHNYKGLVVGDLTSMLRYLCHLDDPNKAQYPIEQVKIISSSLNYESAIQVDEDIIETLIDITEFIVTNHMTNFAQFMLWCARNNRSWFEIASQKATYYIATLVKTEGYNN